MLRIGCSILTLWVLLNALPAIYIVVSSSWFEVDSPAVGQILSPTEIQTLTAKERVSINSVAVYANGLNVALSATLVPLIWLGVMRRLSWAFWTVVAGLGFAVMAGAMGDYVLGTMHPEITLASAAILAVGAIVAGAGLATQTDDSLP